MQRSRFKLGLNMLFLSDLGAQPAGKVFKKRPYASLTFFIRSVLAKPMYIPNPENIIPKMEKNQRGNFSIIAISMCVAFKNAGKKVTTSER